MKKITTLILTLATLTCFGQSIESITEKVSKKICDCIADDIRAYAEIKPEFNRCYDKEFNQIFSLVDSAEQKILVQQGALDKVKNGIIPILNMNCEKIRNLVESDLESAVQPAASNASEPCPTNFSGKDMKKIEKLNGDMVAFNGLVIEVYDTHNDKPYYQVKLEGGNTIWVASLVNSGYEKEGNILRLLGYVSEVGNDENAKKYNKTGYHILALCVIDLDSKQMAMMPGAQLQVKEWLSGTIPKGEE